MPAADQNGIAGRCCPPDYATPPQALRRPADLNASTIYVIGGLYGNPFALDAIERLAACETSPPILIFNGDCHWFDRDLALFEAIEDRLSPHILLRGNVETEMARAGDIGAGCGCAYPEYVEQGVVERSNRILATLREMIAGKPYMRERLARRPATLVAEVGGIRIGIVHGDARQLAGWSFDRTALDDADLDNDRADICRLSGICLFASTHTCTAVMRHYPHIGGGLTITNNGGAGLPNFCASHFGVITRISARPAPVAPLYGLRHQELFIDALAVNYDHTSFLTLFDRLWPEGSDAALSYRQRILAVMNDRLCDAAPRLMQSEERSIRHG